MRKFLSIILSLTLLMSMSVSAAASETNEGTQTVSVYVPTPCYDYTVTIPASCSIEYGNTNKQSIGSVTVTSDYWDNINAEYDCVRVNVTSSTGTDRYLSNDEGDHIPCNILIQDSNGSFDPSHSGRGEVRIDSTTNSNTGLFIDVGDWSDAKAGTTYSITLTYTSLLVQ